MADMIGTSGFHSKAQITLNLPPFAFRADASMVMCCRILSVMNVAAVKQTIVFTMGNNHLSECLRTFHSLSHHTFRLYAVSVIRESNDSGSQCFHIDKLLSLLFHCNGCIGSDVDYGIPLNQLFLQRKMLYIVADRV